MRNLDTCVLRASIDQQLTHIMEYKDELIEISKDLWDVVAKNQDLNFDDEQYMLAATAIRILLIIHETGSLEVFEEELKGYSNDQ